jgi:aldose 1-epimerase
MQVRWFGNFDGRSVFEVTIGTPEGTHARVITWGATVRDLVLLGSAGPERMVLGLGTLEDYGPALTAFWSNTRALCQSHLWWAVRP